MSVARSDPYALLGVGRSATAAEIRAAYLALVARYHPDRHQGNPLEALASERMAEINQAYELLSDPARRAAFDQGRAPAGAGAGAGATSGNGGGGGGGGAPGVARRRGMSPAKWVLLILAFPVLLRSGAGILRALAGLARGLFELLGGFRGTPAGLVVAAVAVVLLALALWRRRRRVRR